MREISAHEVNEFVVIRRSNGTKMTITPALQEGAVAAGRFHAEERRLENAAGKSRALTQINTLLKCPHRMPSCNRKSSACERCRDELGLPARIYKRPPNKTALLLASQKLASRGSAGAGSSSDA